MQPKYIFYFHDNKVQFIRKNEIKTYIFPIYGKIIHIEKFIKELKIFIKKEKIGCLLNPSIRIINSYPFYNSDKELLIMAFNSLGLNKLEFKNEVEIYPNKNDTYLIKTFECAKGKKSLRYPFNLFKDKKQLLSITAPIKENSYLLFGTNKDIPEFVDILKNKNYDNVHYYNNYQTYIIEKSLKKT